MEWLDRPRILYGAEEAAEALSTSVRRIHDLRRAGKLLAVQDGREWKFRHDDLCRYADGLKTSAELDRR